MHQPRQDRYQARTLLFRRMPDARQSPAYERFFRLPWDPRPAIINATTTDAEYPPFPQSLSIKCAWGGWEEYLLDRRRVLVSDDHFLIINDGQAYGTRLRASRPVHTFSVFFPSGMAELSADALLRPDESLLDDPLPAQRAAPEFPQTLLEHDALVTPLLRCLRSASLRDDVDDLWFEEHLHALLEHMYEVTRRLLSKAERLRMVRAATRREVHRRLLLAVDFICSNYQHDISLEDMASAACMSKYHFLRLFRSLHGLTPYQYLTARRVSVARHLLRRTGMPTLEIAHAVGFGDRMALFRNFVRAVGLAPCAYRSARGQRNRDET